ncbi:MAG: DUF2059 domain-containing protein [Oligoflexus sp.]|jgi:hypothetical protein
MKQLRPLIPVLTAILGLTAGYLLGYRSPSSALTSSSGTQSLTSETAEADRATEGRAVTPSVVTEAMDEAKLRQALTERDIKIEQLEKQLASTGSPAARPVLTPEEDNPEYREKLAGELLEVTESRRLIEEAFLSSARMMVKERGPEAQETLNQLMQKHFSWDKMEKAFAKVYTETFTAQELTDLADFYRSDLGISMIKKQPEVMEKTMLLVQEINQENMPKLQKELQIILQKQAKAPTHSKTATP